MDNQGPIKDSKVGMPNMDNAPKKGWCKGRHGVLRVVIVAVGVLLIILISFAAGLGVAYRKARFNCSPNQRGGHDFMGPQMMQRGPVGFFRQFEGRDFRNGNGLVGTVSSISGNNITVTDRDGKQTTVAVNDQTVIRGGGNILKVTDLTQNDQVTVVGNPGDNGVINATLIRVFSGNQNNQPNNDNQSNTNQQ